MRIVYCLLILSSFSHAYAQEDKLNLSANWGVMGGVFFDQSSITASDGSGWKFYPSGYGPEVSVSADYRIAPRVEMSVGVGFQYIRGKASYECLGCFQLDDIIEVYDPAASVGAVYAPLLTRFYLRTPERRLQPYTLLEVSVRRAVFVGESSQKVASPEVINWHWGLRGGFGTAYSISGHLHFNLGLSARHFKQGSDPQVLNLKFATFETGLRYRLKQPQQKS